MGVLRRIRRLIKRKVLIRYKIFIEYLRKPKVGDVYYGAYRDFYMAKVTMPGMPEGYTIFEGKVPVMWDDDLVFDVGSVRFDVVMVGQTEATCEVSVCCPLFLKRKLIGGYSLGFQEITKLVRQRRLVRIANRK